jgi:hypothetical protein
VLVPNSDCLDILSKTSVIFATCEEHRDPHLEFYSSNYEVCKKRYGTMKSPNNEISWFTVK